MTRKQMLKKSTILTKELKIIAKKLKTLPNKNFFITHNGKYSKWFYYDGEKQVYIPKKDRPFAEQLAFKKYLSALQRDLTNEKNAIDAYLKHHTSDGRKSDKLLQDSAYRDLLSSILKPRSQEFIDWMNEPYEKSSNHPEHLTFNTVSGNIVRSKSEMLIDMALFKNKIPFRYENPLKLGTKTYYPDFTIRHPQTGETYYWEHLGRIDDSSYYQKTCDKLKDFIKHDIIPSYNLILTFEAKNHTINSEFIEKIIEHYFIN